MFYIFVGGNMKIKELRLKNGYSQQEIAKLLNTSQSNYSKYERNEIEPDIQTIIKLADYFHTTTDNLLGHNVPYLLDISTLSQEQKELLEEIKKLSGSNCKRVLDFITGLQIAEEEKQKIINLYTKGDIK